MKRIFGILLPLILVMTTACGRQEKATQVLIKAENASILSEEKPQKTLNVLLSNSGKITEDELMELPGRGYQRPRHSMDYRTGINCVRSAILGSVRTRHCIQSFSRSTLVYKHLCR